MEETSNTNKNTNNTNTNQHDAMSLKEGEIHPAAHDAWAFVMHRMQNFPDIWTKYLDLLKNALDNGDRGAQICYYTMKAIEAGTSISQTNLLALTWIMRLIDINWHPVQAPVQPITSVQQTQPQQETQSCQENAKLAENTV